MRDCFLTFHDDDALRGVGAPVVGGHAPVLAGVAGLRVDDLDGNDAVGVGDGVLGGVQLLAGLQPLDLELFFCE